MHRTLFTSTVCNMVSCIFYFLEGLASLSRSNSATGTLGPLLGETTLKRITSFSDLVRRTTKQFEYNLPLGLAGGLSHRTWGDANRVGIVTRLTDRDVPRFGFRMV
jgi:hypothetical protein